MDDPDFEDAMTRSDKEIEIKGNPSASTPGEKMHKLSLDTMRDQILKMN